MVRRLVTFLVVMFATAALSTWWLYEGDLAALPSMGSMSLDEAERAR